MKRLILYQSDQAYRTVDSGTGSTSTSASFAGLPRGANDSSVSIDQGAAGGLYTSS